MAFLLVWLQRMVKLGLGFGVKELLRMERQRGRGWKRIGWKRARGVMEAEKKAGES